MADFADIVNEIKKTNRKLDKLHQASDPSGAAATEDKRDSQQSQKNSEDYLRRIADAMAPVAPKDDGKDSAENKKLGGIFGGVGRALGSLGKGVGRGVGGFMRGIALAAPSAVPFVVAMGALGAGLFAFGTAIGGAVWVVSKMMPDIASGLKEFDDVDGKNLSDVGDGMAMIGAGFASMGAGGAILGIGNLIGGITDGIGGLFGLQPGRERLIDDLKSFGEIELDGEQIKTNSEAMAAYGVAMTKGAAGTALAAMANLTSAVFDGLAGLIGGVPILDKLMAFGAVKVNKENVINNAEAMEHYMIAMVRGLGAQGAETVGAILNFVSTTVDGLSKLIGGEGFLDKTLSGLKKMSDHADVIDPANVEKVAGAMASYTKAMALGAAAAGGRALGGVFNFIGAAADGLTRLIGGEGVLDTQLAGLKKMSKAADEINPVNVANIANAMASYAKAMALGAVGEGGKAVGSIFNFVGNAVDGLTSFIFGGEKKTSMDVMLEGLRKLSDTTGINAANVENNATAMASYAKAMALGAGAAGADALGDIAGFVGGVVSSISSFFGIDQKDPITELKKFAAIIITPAEVAQIEANSKAMESYAAAMIAVGKVEGISAWGEFDKLFGGLVKNISGWLGIDAEPGPLEKLKTFAGIIVTQKEVDQINANASALEVYSRAMVTAKDAVPAEGIWDSLGTLATGILNNVSKWLGVAEGDGPLDKLKTFAAIEVTAAEVLQIQANASALEAYSAAMVTAQAAAPDATVWGSLGTLATGIIGNVGSWLGVGEAEGPLDKLKKFAAIKVTTEEVAQIRSNTTALEAYAAAMVAANSVAPKKGVWESIGDLFSGILGSLTSWFSSEKDPMGMMKTFASTGLTDPELAQLTRNSDAFKVYAEAISNISLAGEVFEDAKVPNLEKFAEQLDASFPALNSAMEKFGDPAMFENYSNSGENLKALFSAFEGVESLGGGTESTDRPGFKRVKIRGQYKWIKEQATGGQFLAGQPMIVGELGPEMILPSTGGTVLNAQRTAQMQQASLRNSVGERSGQPVLNNMPISNISTSQNNTTVTTTPLMHPSPIIGMVNSAV